IPDMNFDDRAADATGLRIPTYPITDLEPLRHLDRPCASENLASHRPRGDISPCLASNRNSLAQFNSGTGLDVRVTRSWPSFARTPVQHGVPPGLDGRRPRPTSGRHVER